MLFSDSMAGCMRSTCRFEVDSKNPNDSFEKIDILRKENGSSWSSIRHQLTGI